MNRIMVIIGALIVGACVALVSMVFAEMPGPDPNQLWKYITKSSPYKEWSF